MFMIRNQPPCSRMSITNTDKYPGVYAASIMGMLSDKVPDSRALHTLATYSRRH
jgi:hypothetical protein